MVEGERMQRYSETENQEKQKQEGRRAFDVKIRSWNCTEFRVPIRLTYGHFVLSLRDGNI